MPVSGQIFPKQASFFTFLQGVESSQQRKKVVPMKNTLWTRNFTLVTAATVLGAAGGIAGGFALSFLVFDETGSTLASALILAMELIPYFLIPLLVAPWMDRMPRKPFLVGGDVLNGLLYGLAGLYLLTGRFSYVGYLGFSLLLSTLGAFDQLAYNCIYPQLIPAGMEEKGYAVSSMLYPVLKVVMTPLAAVLFDALGVGWMLLLQAALSLLAAAVESRIQITETRRDSGRFSFKLWWGDICEAARYLKEEPGLRSIYSYMAVTNGVAGGYAPLLVAFFRTAPGLSATLYSLFSVAEFLGRSLGGAVQYRLRLRPEKKFPFTFFVYQFYEVMDMILLWIPYPLMLVNRAMAGFLGINSATMRQAAVQRYLPEHLRARINAFEGMCITLSSTVFSLALGALGEVLDYKLVVTLGAGFALLFCWGTIWRRRRDVAGIFLAPKA